ncbi:hypothetical protein L1987_25211 [Smallanthus sonchifolius]|uniref:Uncharacterized protein n=1 Tax=Smallanthus sonchifolius TaxID=185202 RepID=A0ACB9IN54_9ASTR|nr:hypothetical protein L1987_25211 [Smallanthus sonchifolius]
MHQALGWRTVVFRKISTLNGSIEGLADTLLLITVSIGLLIMIVRMTSTFRRSGSNGGGGGRQRNRRRRPMLTQPLPSPLFAH